MGKVKKTGMKKKGARLNPTGVVEVESEAIETSSEISILQKLSSASVEERHCACLSLANIVLDEESAARLLDAGVVRELGPLLVDADRSVREAAAGALRNLSLCGNQKACEQMIAADVMTPVMALFGQAFAELKVAPRGASGGASAVEEARDSVSDGDRLASCVEQTLHLLLNLTEASPVAVEVFNRQGLLPSVIECVQPTLFSEPVVLAAAQCLQTVTESNPAAASIILSTPAMLHHLTTLATSLPATEANVHLQIMLACALSNLVPAASSDVRQALLPIIFNVSAAALQIDANAAVASISSGLIGATEEGQEGSSELKLVNNVLSAQQTALEVLTNLCSIEDGGEEDDEWEEAEEGDGDMEDGEEEEEAAENMDDAASAACGAGATASIVVKHLSAALSDHQLLAKIAEKCEGVPAHLHQMLGCSEAGQSLLARCERVQCRALTALQSLSSALPVAIIGTPETLLGLWTMVFSAATKTGISNDLLEALTGTLRTTATLLKQSQASCVPVAHIQPLCQACQEPLVALDVRINLLATLTVLGSMLTSQPDQLPALIVLSKCFVDSATHAASVRVVSEALDGIFDVFADGGEVGDAAVEASGMLPALQQLAPKLKTKVRNGVRSLGREYPLLHSAHLNLVRFLKYMAKKKKTA